MLVSNSRFCLFANATLRKRRNNALIPNTARLLLTFQSVSLATSRSISISMVDLIDQMMLLLILRLGSRIESADARVVSHELVVRLKIECGHCAAVALRLAVCPWSCNNPVESTDSQMVWVLTQHPSGSKLARTRFWV